MGANDSAQKDKQMENYHIHHTLKLSTGNHRDPRREEAMMASTLSLMPRRSGSRPWLARPYVSRSGVCHFFVEADVQVVAGLVGDEEADGDGAVRGCLPDVYLNLGLQHAEFPQPAAITHDHGTHRLLDLPTSAAPSEPAPDTHTGKGTVKCAGGEEPSSRHKL